MYELLPIIPSRKTAAFAPAGHRTAMSTTGTASIRPDTIAYTYNPRNEVTRATAQNDSLYHYDYTFDAIGNRQTATYTANPLNQYTAINTFEPQLDADDNQTLIQTGTGIWQVTYNGENRPVLWTQGDTRIEMVYDRLGRRISYASMTGTTPNRQNTFLYKGYLCVQEFTEDSFLRDYIWDPTEPIVTRPLQMRIPAHNSVCYYMFDGNKNVADLIAHNPANGIAAHYEYAPFGAVTRATYQTTQTQYTLIADNPYRFSSEYHDDELGLTYYNFRHFNPANGRWLSRDLLGEEGGINLYGFLNNNPVRLTDYAGLYGNPICGPDGPVAPSDPYASWNPFNPVFPPAPPRGPGVCDQINPLGVRGSTGTANYTEWFEQRFPNTVKGAINLLTQRIKAAACNQKEDQPTTLPDLVSDKDDVDIIPDMSRFGDEPQSRWEKYVKLGHFEIKADNVRLHWLPNCCFSFTATAFVQEHTGADNPFETGKCCPDALWITGMFFPRDIRMAEWPINGSDCCPPAGK